MVTKTKHFQNCLGVFQGGGCRGSAFVGAYKHTASRGVSFSEIVGTSAGSIVAAFIAAGANPEQLEEIIRRLDFSKLLNDPLKIDNYSSPWFAKLIYPFDKDIYNVLTKMGMHDSSRLQAWMDDELKKLLKKNTSVKFKDLIIPTTIVVSDLKSKTIKLFGNFYDDNEFVAEAVRYSCNIPIYFQPVANRFVDGGLLSNLPSFVFQHKQDSIYEKILAFSLTNGVESYEMSTIKDYLTLLADTAIEGSVNIQMSLQKNIHVINIQTGSIKATDFDKMTKENIDILIEEGEKQTKEFFENEIANIKDQYKRPEIYHTYFKAYNEISNSLTSKVNEVIVSDINTEWVYELFPTLVGWVRDNSRITILTKVNNDDAVHGPYRKRLLKLLGCQLIDVEDLPIRGIVINGDNVDNTPFSIVYNENIGNELPYHSKLYYGEEDYRVISLLRNQCLGSEPFSFTNVDIKIQEVEKGILFDQLRNVRQYNNGNVTFHIEELPLTELIFLTRFVRGFKFRQIDQLFDLFKINNVPAFIPACLLFPNGKNSLVAPPIIEKNGDKFYVIEGNTRLTYAYKNGMKKLYCVVVNGVSDPLPSSGKFKINEILITDQKKLGKNRYEDFNYSHFRKIENAVRNPITTLI